MVLLDDDDQFLKVTMLILPLENREKKMEFIKFIYVQIYSTYSHI